MPLQGVALTPETWERDVLPRRLGAWSPTWLDQLCSGGELVWIGAGALGRSSGKVALYFREDVRWLGPPTNRGERAGGPAPRRDPRAARRPAPRSGPTCWWTSAEVETAELQEALWDLVWAGEVTNDAWAPLRAPRLTVARDQAAGARAAVRQAPPARAPRRCRGVGR